MPTIKDIAVKAGVSHGTVSNVLNKRGNVSAEKIQLVERAAKELGYKINAQAQQLRAGMTKKVCVILPEISTKRYNDFYAGLDAELRKSEFDIELICTDHLIYNEKTALKKAQSLNVLATVVVSALLKNKGLYTEGDRLIFVERKPRNLPGDISFASFDYEKAGREIAEQCVTKGYKNIALLCGGRKYSNYKEFLNGAISVLDDFNGEYREFVGRDEMSLMEAFELLNEKEDFDAVIAASEEDVKYLKKARRYCCDKKIPDIYALCSKTMEELEGVYPYMLNYKLLGKRTAEHICQLWGEGEKAEKKRVFRMENDGFFHWKAERHKGPSDYINMLCIQNSTSRAIKLLLPEFQRESGIRVNLMEVSYDELHNMAWACCEEGSPYDLLRIDMAWLERLGSKLYRKLDEQDERVRELQENIKPELWENYSKSAGGRYAFPLEPCVQLLFYRKDLFENELLKREFFETYKRRLEVPTTFREYNETARFFCRKYNPNSPTQFGTTVTYGRSLLAACDFLPRYREYGTSIFDEEGRVNLLGKEMRGAIESYLETCQYSDGEIYQWWGESTRRFAEGNTAMHIVFTNYASAMLGHAESKINEKVGYASVPGGQPMLGGGAIGISKFSSKYDQCMEFLRWIYRTDIAEMICFMGGYICNRKIDSNMDIQERYPWIEYMEKSFSKGWRNYSDRQGGNFDEVRFEDILGRVIRGAAFGIGDLEAAMLKAQQECDREFYR